MDIEHRGPAVVIRVEGELVLSATREFENRIGDVYASGARQVIIDLRGVEFVDSTGIWLLLSVWKESKRTGFEFTLVRAPEKVCRLFELTRVDAVLPLREEMPELLS